MCDPVSASLGAIQGASSLMSAGAKKKAGKYNAKIANHNAVIQDKLAADAIRRGDRDEASFRMRHGQFKSEQVTRMLAGGGAITGSNARVLDDTDVFGELDALMIRSNSKRESISHKANAQGLRQQATLAEMGGDADATSTIMGGATQVAGTWYTAAGAQ